MKNFVGIDLGTTNSAICTFNGEETRIWKSPDQKDVTPSAIFIDRRGNKYIGERAYNLAPTSPGNAATLFKRLMGTSTPINLPGTHSLKTPEECSAEVLKVLFGYLPEEMRNDPDIGTVITVPAAFNQMQKDATMQAAQMAGLGNVALMQEPVAAVMSVMRARKTDGTFLIYDIGGGTLDIAIAESIGGHINLLAHGGKAMCGGRDFDRLIFDNIVKSWLLNNFNLPENFTIDPNFASLRALAIWATEKAKIELSSCDDTTIKLSENELRTRDQSGSEIYLEIPIDRETFNQLISEQINESIEPARETLQKTGLSPHDLDRIIFIGGPTNYKPLRDKVAFELGIPISTEVNPMTAVAEGASLFAESIDWSSKSRVRKNARGQLFSRGAISINFNYIARTPESRAKVVAQLGGEAISGTEFQIDSMDTGWTSGRVSLATGATVEVTLNKYGENMFKVFVFDALGSPISIENNQIIITRTAAMVDAIPASHSIGIEALEKLGGRSTLAWLVREGDSLPREGMIVFKAAEALKAGSSSSLKFKLWEGEIEDPITDNRPIGVFEISGSDFEDGVIPAGADLQCEYQVLDSGNIILEVSVECIGGAFHSGRNFYSRLPGQMDFSTATTHVISEGNNTLERINEISQVVDDPKLNQANDKLETAISLDPAESETERVQEAMEKVFEAKKLLAKVRVEHLKEIRQLELDSVNEFFEQNIVQLARPSEKNSFRNLVRTAKGNIARNDRDFETHLEKLKEINFDILWRQDWFVVERFKWMAKSSYLFGDKYKFEELTKLGFLLIQTDEIDKLREIVWQLYQIQINSDSENDMFNVANIIRG